jgi:hypothetical protein
MLCELPFLYEKITRQTKDSGIVSGVLVSSILAISWIFSTPMDIGSMVVSFAFITLGVTIRVISKLS